MLNRMNAPGKFRGVLTCKPAVSSILSDRLAPGRLRVLRIVLAPLEVFSGVALRISLLRCLLSFLSALRTEASVRGVPCGSSSVSPSVSSTC